MPTVAPKATAETLMLSPSGSVSVPAAPRMTPLAADTTNEVSSSALPVSALATGASLTPPTSMATVAVEVATPSVTV